MCSDSAKQEMLHQAKLACTAMRLIGRCKDIPPTSVFAVFRANLETQVEMKWEYRDFSRMRNLPAHTAADDRRPVARGGETVSHTHSKYDWLGTAAVVACAAATEQLLKVYIWSLLLRIVMARGMVCVEGRPQKRPTGILSHRRESIAAMSRQESC